MPTLEQTREALKVVQAVAEAIRELKTVPSGHLYTQLMGKISLDTYNKIITTLKNTGLVEEKAHELIWKGE